MISGISKKVIFFSLLFINFFQQTKSAEISKINKDINNPNIKLYLSYDSNLKTSSNNLNNFTNNNLYDHNSYVKFLKKRTESFLVAKVESQKELIIQYDKQSEINDVIYAEGNLSVSYEGKLLKADNLIYDKLNKKINAKGNISLVSGDQLFRASKLEYSFISEKGYLLDVKGSINTNNLIDDLSSNFTSSDSEKLKTLIELN